jgi:toxin FitB
MYLLDTNVLSEVRKATRCDRAVMAWFGGQPITGMSVSVITIRELYFGAYRQKWINPARERELMNWIDGRIIPQFGSNILSIDIETMRIHAGLPMPNANLSADSLIAATSVRHDLTVVTRNTKDFDAFGIRTLNPWTFE